MSNKLIDESYIMQLASSKECFVHYQAKKQYFSSHTSLYSDNLASKGLESPLFRSTNIREVRYSPKLMRYTFWLKFFRESNYTSGTRQFVLALKFYKVASVSAEVVWL